MKKFLLTLIAAAASVTAFAGEVSYDFVNNDYGMERLSGNTSVYLPSPHKIVSEGIALTFTKDGSANGFRLWADGLRFMKGGNTITVSGGAECTVTGVQLVFKQICPVTIGETSYTDLDSISWTGSQAAPVFKLSNSSGTVALQRVHITYTGTAGEVVETPAEPDPDEKGQVNNPYTASEAKAAAAALEEGVTIADVYVKGFISSATISTQFGNADYYLSDNADTEETFLVFRGYWLDGAKFDSEDQLAVGAEVTVFGTLVNYKNKDNTFTPEMTSGSRIISYKAEGGTPVEPTPDDALYTFLADTTAVCEFTFDDGTLPEALTYVWSWAEYQGSHYMKASAFKDNTKYATEAYAVSPVIDLTKVKNITCSFEHAAKFQTNITTDCKFVVREDGTTAWTELTIPTWPAAGAWTYVNSGDIDLNAYAGKKIQLAYKYVSTDEAADTWQIKNLKIKGEKDDSAAELIEAAQGEAEYFNLQGVRVANPSNGLYIRRQGGNAVKVYVK